LIHRQRGKTKTGAISDRPKRHEAQCGLSNRALQHGFQTGRFLEIKIVWDALL